MVLKELLERFDGVKRLNDSSYQCKCPVHADKQASLTISEKDGKILLHCHAGCDTDSVLAHVGLSFRDLHNETNNSIPYWKTWLEKAKNGIVEDVYYYRDIDGNYLYSKVRLKTAQGKAIVYGIIKNDRIQLSIGNQKKVLYNLAEIEAARKEGKPLYLPEGEKDCKTLQEKGFYAATYGATGDWKAEFAPLFQGIDLVVLPDNDVPGRKVAERIIKDCMPYVKSLKSVITSKEDKGDVTDYFNTGRTTENFLKLVEKSPYIPLTPLPEQSLPASVVENEQKSGNMTKFVKSPLQLRCGEWVCMERGVYKWISDKKTGEEIKLYATRQQILPSGLIENIETGEQKYILSYSLRRNHGYLWKNIRVEPATCCSKTKIIGLANVGIRVTDQTAKYLVNYIDDMYSYNEDILPVKKSISHLGWINNDFFPYVQDILFDGDIEQERLVQSIQGQGNFEIWAKECQRFRENLLVRIMTDACLASPLIEKIGGLCFVLHLWGASGHGKTVALLVSASIWGKPDALLSSADATPNYCTNRAAFLRNLPVLIDETQVANVSRENGLDKLIYLMTEGKTRGRLDRNSQERNGKSWSCVSIFTGERPIVGDRSGAGAVNRVIELELEGKLFEDFGYVLGIVRDNYGHAGRKFVEYIQQNDLKAITEEYHAICKEIEQCSTSTGKQNQSLAFILLADRLASRCLFKKEPPLAAEDLVKFLKSEKEVSTPERAYQFLINWIAANKNLFTEDSLRIYGKIEGNTCLFNQNELMDVLKQHNYDFDAVKKEWANMGYLIKNSANKYQHYTTIYGGIKAKYIKLVLEFQSPPEFITVDEKQEKIPF